MSSITASYATPSLPCLALNKALNFSGAVVETLGQFLALTDRVIEDNTGLSLAGIGLVAIPFIAYAAVPVFGNRQPNYRPLAAALAPIAIFAAYGLGRAIFQANCL